jgi:GDP-L-fucose synthase
MMQPHQRIYVAGHRGLVGSAFVRALEARGCDRIITRTRQELDLLDQQATRSFFEREKPDLVLCAAAKVGGIGANVAFPASFIYENLTIETNIIHAAFEAGVQHLIFLGSSCIYPRNAPQPIPESALLTGPLEPTNAPYSVAKIAGIALCEAYNRQYGTRYRPVMPTNLYGPHDTFDAETGHVIPSLIVRFHRAQQEGKKDVTLWGTGTPRREFLHSDDLADACLFLLDHDDATDLINIGAGTDLTIRELADLIADVVGYRGRISFDAQKPDGAPRKLLNVERLTTMGWRPKRELRDGLRQTYEWYLSNEG